MVMKSVGVVLLACCTAVGHFVLTFLVVLEPKPRCFQQDVMGCSSFQPNSRVG